MNIPVKAPQSCDECGKTVAKIWRVHKGHKYCSTCYARVFKRRMCPKCGNFARLPKNEPDAVCRKCQVDKPCTRCGKTDYEIGKITNYGPVCNACSPYFREPEPCEVCGEPSRRLARIFRLGHNHRVCPKCARADHGVCVACRRPRLLEQAADGRMLCKACREGGETPCPVCAKPMPAGRGKQCEDCYWRGLLEKRVALSCAGFSVPAMAAHFREFGEWLGNEVGHHKAAITLHKYLLFFLDIEKQWREIPEYAVLLKHFGTLRLRRVLLPMKWLQDAGLVVPDDSAKRDDSDQRRIVAILDRMGKDTRESLILNGYHNVLLENQKTGKTTLRSIRLAMTPAAALLLKGREMGIMPPDQKVLDTYLKKTPGQRAAVSGFVGYLRAKHGVLIAIPKVDPGRATRNRRKKLEAEMLDLMREDGEGDEFKRKWLSVALAYFHRLPKKIGKTILDGSVDEDEKGFTVMIGEKNYWAPQPSGLIQSSQNAFQYE